MDGVALGDTQGHVGMLTLTTTREDAPSKQALPLSMHDSEWGSARVTLEVGSSFLLEKKRKIAQSTL